MALWGESRGLFAELETEFEAVVVGEQRTYVAETRVCHATGNFAGGTEEGEEFVTIEKDADAGSGAHYLGMEIHQTTEKGKVEHLLAGVEGVGAADGHTVEVCFKGVVGIENEGGAAFFETKTVRFSSSLASSTPAAATPPAWARSFGFQKRCSHRCSPNGPRVRAR